MANAVTNTATFAAAGRVHRPQARQRVDEREVGRNAGKHKRRRRARQQEWQTSRRRPPRHPCAPPSGAPPPPFVSSRVNCFITHDGSTRLLLFPLDLLIEWMSTGMPLQPGAIIATGTPDGVGFSRTPPEYLEDGAVMETKIEGIGTMRNVFSVSQ